MLLKLFTFGGFSIVRGDNVVAHLASRKTEALVLYLVSEKRPQAREMLADMFWDRRSQQRASGNLRVVLSSIRKNMPEYFELSREQVSVKPDANIWLDSAVFEHSITCARTAANHKDLSLQIDHLEVALRTYRGPFLEGFYLKDAAGFERWALQERDRFEGLAERAYELLCAAYLADERLDQAASSVAEWLKMSPLNETAHRALMKLYAVSGNRSAALQQFETCRQGLAEELDLAPDEETFALYEQILSGVYPPATQAESGTEVLKPTGPGAEVPALLNRFIGRVEQRRTVVEALSDPHVRLVTLIGPGGVGKTRLAIQVAHEIRTIFPDGIFFVDLAPIADPELVGNRIARAVGIREGGINEAISNIRDQFRRRQALFLVDNFEQVVQAAPAIGDMLSGTNYLKILATSREPLRIYGEHLVAVDPLPVPENPEISDYSQLVENEAVRLFVDRARAADPSFIIAPVNARQIAEICVALDGLPLAIELAAARIRMFRPEEMLQQLQAPLDLLDQGPRDFSARHRKLRATLDWSYALLDHAEQSMFAVLGCFMGGSDLEAIEFVAPDPMRENWLQVVESLLNKNLLVQVRSADSGSRFTMLHTIHHYAAARLAALDEASQIRQRHALYYLKLVEVAGPELRGPGQEMWSRRLKSEYDNIRAAIHWAFSEGDAGLGFRMVGAMGLYWYYEGPITDAEKWFLQGLPKIPGAPQEFLPAFFNTGGLIQFVLGNQQAGMAWNQMALDTARAVGDRQAAAWALFWRSAQATGDPALYEAGLGDCKEALQEFERMGDLAGMAWTYNQVGELSRLLKDYHQARDAYEKCLRLSRETGNRIREAVALVNLSVVSQHQGDHADAERFSIDGLRLLDRLGLTYHSAIALALTIGPLVSLGRKEKAITLLGAAYAMFERISAELQPADQVEIERYAFMAKKELGEEAYQHLLSEGKRLQASEAIQFALDREKNSLSDM